MAAMSWKQMPITLRVYGWRFEALVTCRSFYEIYILFFSSLCAKIITKYTLHWRAEKWFLHRVPPTEIAVAYCNGVYAELNFTPPKYTQFW